jgi:sugar phosphate isomerase/epimerase
MTAFTRREFGRMVVAGVPLAWASTRAAAAGRLVIGVTTDSFRELPRVEGRDNVDDVLQAVRHVGATHIDLALAHLEPAPPSTAPFLGGSPAYPRLVVLSPQEIAATNSRARAALRTWRLRHDSAFVDDVRGRLSAAGLTAHACSVMFDESFTDEEIDVTFRQARALGASALSSPLTFEMASRLVPFAERHRLSVAIHNQMDGNADRAIATADLPRALALSPVFSVKLDVGHLTASNCDAVAELRAHLSRVSHVVLKDRLRNKGASQVFGEGDTPLRGVIEVVRDAPRPVPALVEYDYTGLRTPADEVAASMTFVRRLAGVPSDRG